jgi:hypothetical protein
MRSSARRWWSLMKEDGIEVDGCRVRRDEV